MADSGDLVMMADNAMQHAIAPSATAAWQTLIATGHQSINVMVYSSGYQTEWSDGIGWALLKKFTIGDNGLVARIEAGQYTCIRVQGPVDQVCRVVTHAD
jgi:hypothetical protein